MTHLRRAAPWLLLLLLGGCAPHSPRPETSSLLAAQADREQMLAQRPDWSLHGRVAVSAGSEGGSGSLSWQRRGVEYVLDLQAPVTGRAFRLSGDGTGVELAGLDGGPFRGYDAAELLRQQLGWDVPVRQMGYWVRGMRAPDSPADLGFGENGLPARLVQDGWVVEYREWFTGISPPLPQRVFASRGVSRVRLVIHDWSVQ